MDYQDLISGPTRPTQNLPVAWSASTSSLQRRSVAPPPDPSGLVNLWSRESREVAMIKREARLEGHRDMAQHKLRAFRNFLMKLEAMQLIEDADELMDFAEQKAMQNPQRADIYIEATLKFIEMHQRIHALNHMFRS